MKWYYYNHAMIPDCAPHEEPNTQCIEDKSIWKNSRTVLLARWTTAFDCGYETDWWYIIKDGPYLIEDLPSHQRKHIRQALRKCYVRMIDCEEYEDELYRVYLEAIQRYEQSEHNTEKESFIKFIKRNAIDHNYWAAFSIEDDTMIGYMMVYQSAQKKYAEIHSARFSALYMKLRMSDALYHTVLDFYLNEKKFSYVSSGERSISHITNTQEYKIKEFAYRKAYCHLNIKYNPKIKWIVLFLYPFRRVLAIFNNIKIVHKINTILKMEEISRETKK